MVNAVDFRPALSAKQIENLPLVPFASQKQIETALNSPVRLAPAGGRRELTAAEKFSRPSEKLPLTPKTRYTSVQKNILDLPKLNAVKAGLELERIYSTPKDQRTPELNFRAVQLNKTFNSVTFDSMKEYNLIRDTVRSEIANKRTSFRDGKFN